MQALVQAFIYCLHLNLYTAHKRLIHIHEEDFYIRSKLMKPVELVGGWFTCFYSNIILSRYTTLKVV